MQAVDRFLRVGLPLTVVSVLITVILVGWNTQPDRYHMGFAPEQPIPYSHKVHAGDNQIPCEYCHSGAREGRHAMVPALEACFKCHELTLPDSPHIQRLKAALEAGESFPWKRVHDLPDHVYFDHSPHVALGIACQECHGPVERMEIVEQVLNMRMGACLQCHRGQREWSTPVPPPREGMVAAAAGHPTGPTNCNACHR
jgi:hypothetical protein